MNADGTTTKSARNLHAPHARTGKMNPVVLVGLIVGLNAVVIFLVVHFSEPRVNQYRGELSHAVKVFVSTLENELRQGALVDGTYTGSAWLFGNDCPHSLCAIPPEELSFTTRLSHTGELSCYDLSITSSKIRIGTVLSADLDISTHIAITDTMEKPQSYGAGSVALSNCVRTAPRP